MSSINWKPTATSNAKSRGDRYSAADGVEGAVRDFLMYLSQDFRTAEVRNSRLSAEAFELPGNQSRRAGAIDFVFVAKLRLEQRFLRAYSRKQRRNSECR
jgi:hypothetical protein